MNKLYNTTRDDSPERNIIIHKRKIARAVRRFVYHYKGEKFSLDDLEASIHSIALKGDFYPSNLRRIDDDPDKRRRKDELRMCQDAANLVIEEMATQRPGKGKWRKYRIATDKVEQAMDSIEGLFVKESKTYIMVQTAKRTKTAKRRYRGGGGLRKKPRKPFTYKPQLEALAKACLFARHATYVVARDNDDYDDTVETRRIGLKLLSEVSQILEKGDQ